MNILIRPMEEKDVESAGSLESAVFSMPWKSEDFLEMIQRPYAYYFVAEDAGEIVGICGLIDAAGEGEIVNVVTAPSKRRRGIARSLLKRALDQCSQLEIKDVTLEVRTGNEPAIRLYESFGFKGEGIRPNFYEKPKEDALIMWKRS